MRGGPRPSRLGWMPPALRAASFRAAWPRCGLKRGAKFSELQALRTLNTQENSFLEVVNIMLTNSTSATVNNEGLHALSLVHDPRPEVLRECADSCGFEVIVSAMGKCSKSRRPAHNRASSPETRRWPQTRRPPRLGANSSMRVRCATNTEL